MTVVYPESMTKKEADLYVNRSKRKFGESNIRSVTIEICGDKVVEIQTELLEGSRERIGRISPETLESM